MPPAVAARTCWRKESSLVGTPRTQNRPQACASSDSSMCVVCCVLRVACLCVAAAATRVLCSGQVLPDLQENNKKYVATRADTWAALLPHPTNFVSRSRSSNWPSGTQFSCPRPARAQLPQPALSGRCCCCTLYYFYIIIIIIIWNENEREGFVSDLHSSLIARVLIF